MLKIILATFSPLLFFFTSAAQTKRIPKNLILFDIGTNKHGTGDIKGLLAGFSFQAPIKRKSFLIAAVETTIHDGKVPLYYTDPSGDEVNASYRHTTAGLQLNAGTGYHILNSNNHKIGIQGSLVLRYQSSSYFDELAIYYPPISGTPFPLMTTIHREPQRIVSVGGKGELFYRFFFKEKFLSGIKAGFQADSNGDMLTGISLSIGYCFQQ